MNCTSTRTARTPEKALWSAALCAALDRSKTRRGRLGQVWSGPLCPEVSKAVHSTALQRMPAVRAIILGGTLLFLATGLWAQGIPTVVRADYRNELRVPPGVNPATEQASSATVFGGHVGPYAIPGSVAKPVIPEGGGARLEESSFGQCLASDLPTPDFPETFLLSIQRELLYPPPGTPRQQLELPNGWAFRYKMLLYSNDAQGIVASQQMPRELFDEDEKEKVAAALEQIRTLLAWAPGDPTLRHAYLDVFYDQLVAECQFVLKGEKADLAAYRLGLKDLESKEFIIDKEIAVYTNLLHRLQAALGEYGQMLGDYSGVDVSAVDPTAPPGTRFGYHLFQHEQPFRNQTAAQFLDADGVVKTVPDLDPQTGPLDPSTESRVLFAGYKDFVGIVTLLRDYTQGAAELAQLYGTRGRRTSTSDDVAEGLALINSVQQVVGLEIQVLVGMFSPDAFPPGDVSGARAAISGVQLGLAELGAMKGFLEGRSNPLGFDPNFLVLIQEAPGLNPTSEDQPFDSYDSLVRWIQYTPTSPLRYARGTFEDAWTSYRDFRAYADRVAEELEDVDDAYWQRFTEITGYDRENSAEFDGITPLPGSELWQANHSLTNLQLQLLSAKNEQRILGQQVTNAIEFVNAATNKAAALDKVFNKYKNQTSHSWTEIQVWAGIAAGAQAEAEGVYAALGCISSLGPGAGWGGVVAGPVALIAGGVNSGIQATAAARTAVDQQRIEYANAGYTAELAKVDTTNEAKQALMDFNALRREEISFASDLVQLNAEIVQQQAHRTALLRELERIRCNGESARAAAAGRYYADPIHAQRAESQLLRADMAFRRAQRWVFFAQRALEYKWNKDFVSSFEEGRDYDRGTIFKLRNVEELDELVGALEDFNTANLLNFNREPFVDRISLRDDVLLPFPASGPDTGWRTDPQTMQMVPKNDLFRLILKGERASPFVERDGSGNLVIKLNTVTLNKSSGFFYLGPTYSDDGSILTAGKHLDKIEWIKLNAVSSTQSAPVEADLRYGGTCYIRSAVPACFNPTNAFLLPNATRVFPFQYFYTLDNGVSFQAAEYQRDTVKLAFSPISREPEQNIPNSIYENRFLKERSVATTDLRLTIGKDRIDLDRLEDLELYVRHLFVSITVVPDCN